MSTKPETLAAQRVRVRRELAEREARLQALIEKFGSAQFECGEWDRNESDEDYDTVWKRSILAENELRAAFGLPPRRP